MFGFRLDQAKSLFFDRPGVMARVDAAERRALSKFGAFVRRRARTSIRKRRLASQPGEPPSSHVGTLRRGIMFAFDPQSRSVVIGPVVMGSANRAPQILEHGGVAEVFERQRQRRRFVNVARRPYMRPAFEAELPRATGLFKDTL